MCTIEAQNLFNIIVSRFLVFNMVQNTSNKPDFKLVQVPNIYILTQNLYYNYYYPKPKYPIFGYLDPFKVTNSVDDIIPKLDEMLGRMEDPKGPRTQIIRI